MFLDIKYSFGIITNILIMEVNTLTKTREQRLADLFTQGEIIGFSNNDLCYIIECVRPLRQEAKSRLLPIIVPQTLEQIMSEIKQLA